MRSYTEGDTADIEGRGPTDLPTATLDEAACHPAHHGVANAQDVQEPPKVSAMEAARPQRGA